MGDVRLSSPRVQVVRDGHEPLEVQTDNRDMVRWEMTRAKQRPPWPKFDEAPIKWLTFLSWSAATRAGLTEDGYEKWESVTLGVKSLDSDDMTGDEDGRPFAEEAAPD